MTEQDTISDEEEFHNSFHYFVTSLALLAAPALEQCQSMGNYNVAWELKDEVERGAYLVGRGYLSSTQEAWVAALIGSLVVANTQVLPAGPDPEANLAAMENACWEPLRFIARETLSQLESFTTINTRYLFD